MAREVPMELVIGATTHAGGLDADPFATTPFAPATPLVEEQFAADIAFVDRIFAGETIERSISYMVLGTKTWKTTDTWPPAGVHPATFHLAAGELATAAPAAAEGDYTVDPSTSSGAFNRWAAQRGGLIFYGDRDAAPGNRIGFVSPPLEADQEIVGSPELCLALRSDQPDGLVIAYLEDVAPDGRVTYLTEGILRLIHRATAGSPCDPAPGTARSFERADGAPVVPGEVMHVELPLLPVAAKIAAGHRLRLSLAGADAGWFEPLTAVPAKWTLTYGPSGSTFIVPMRPWTDD
jgi:uncharacterized protein